MSELRRTVRLIKTQIILDLEFCRGLPLQVWRMVSFCNTPKKISSCRIPNIAERLDALQEQPVGRIVRIFPFCEYLDDGVNCCWLCQLPQNLDAVFQVTCRLS
ncbi:hypothetical protein [Streptomyces ochraceiscleroticus]|uniref:Uncharacterized protein n=1 Tax=Streptomyces ochraceiscleroticus TaxID=47761 RepID=A0ABW1MRL6_9ACTN|nr:hypothetical protein [Streptomyces ochraceiscleroticus]